MDAFLIEAVDVPDEALKHYFVFKVGEQASEGAGIEAFAVYEAGGAAAGEVFVWVFVFLAFGEGGDLGGEVCFEFGLAVGVVYGYVIAALAFDEADELDWDDVCALVEELVE